MTGLFCAEVDRVVLGTANMMRDELTTSKFRDAHPMIGRK